MAKRLWLANLFQTYFFNENEISGRQNISFIISKTFHHLNPNVVVFAWEAYEKGTDVHLQADPTKLELLHREYKVKKEDFKQDLKGGVLEKVILIERRLILI